MEFDHYNLEYAGYGFYLELQPLFTKRNQRVIVVTYGKGFLYGESLASAIASDPHFEPSLFGTKYCHYSSSQASCGTTWMDDKDYITTVYYT